MGKQKTIASATALLGLCVLALFALTSWHVILNNHYSSMLQSPDEAAQWEAAEKLERLDSRLAEEWYIHKLKCRDVQPAAQGLCRIGNDLGEMVTVKFPIRASSLPGDEEQARQAKPLCAFNSRNASPQDANSAREIPLREALRPRSLFRPFATGPSGRAAPSAPPAGWAS
jgi:hypothetical protein